METLFMGPTGTGNTWSSWSPWTRSIWLRITYFRRFRSNEARRRTRVTHLIGIYRTIERETDTMRENERERQTQWERERDNERGWERERMAERLIIWSRSRTNMGDTSWQSESDQLRTRTHFKVETERFFWFLKLCFEKSMADYISKNSSKFSLINSV